MQIKTRVFLGDKQIKSSDISKLIINDPHINRIINKTIETQLLTAQNRKNQHHKTGGPIKHLDCPFPNFPTHTQMPNTTCEHRNHMVQLWKTTHGGAIGNGK